MTTKTKDRHPFIGVYVDEELKAELTERARENRRSLSQELLFILYDWLDKSRKEENENFKQ